MQTTPGFVREQQQAQSRALAAASFIILWWIRRVCRHRVLAFCHITSRLTKSDCVMYALTMIAFNTAHISLHADASDTLELSRYWTTALNDINSENTQDVRGGLQESLRRIPPGITVKAKYDGKSRKAEICIARTGKDEHVVLKGHLLSSFVARAGMCYFADFSSNMPGCNIIAYSLLDGKKAWETKLVHRVPQGASGYFNRVELSVEATNVAARADKKEGKRLVVIVNGEESYCRYCQVVDCNTGKIVSVRNIRYGFGNVRMSDNAMPLP